ncbi:unnamed protein product [Durusdinium trenchii]|uniref:Uncharacterized protein n=1 Tax=Durusdinium trenchii TaxID=1381693 RepID=A0ABP0QTX6_9DINO
MQPPERRSLHGVCLWLLLALSGGTDVENVCEKGFYQEDPIVFGCQGGKGRQSMILTSRAAAQGQFSWEVPKDTADLSVEVLFEPLKSLHGSAKLSAKCADTGEVILGETQSLLNESAKLVTAHGAQWSWSGNATHRSGSFSLWLRVHGPLHCDLGFRVENDLESNLAADVRYSWSHIKPCPKQLKGCEECPKDKCHPDDVAVCDGSRYWECQPHGDGGGTCHVCEANSGVALKRLRSMTMMQLSQFVVMFCLADMIHMINLGCRAGGGL